MRWAAVALLMSGCASIAPIDSARTLPKDSWRLGTELGEQANFVAGAVRAYPTAELVYRRGLNDWLEGAVRLGGTGAGVEGKLQLHRSETTLIAISPSAAWLAARKQGFALDAFSFGLPVLVGIPLANDRELVFAPQLQDSLISGSEGSAGGSLNTLAVGASVGVVARVKRWTVAPGVGVLVPVLYSASRSDADAGSTIYLSHWSLQAGCSILWGP